MSFNISGNHFNADHVGIQQINYNHSPDPLEQLRPAKRASYKTRHGAEDDQARGCMAETRVQILADIEAWAQDETTPKVYWLNGHLGTGKTSIAHTLSERLDRQKLLGASFFCSRSELRDASRIIPTVAAMLARSDAKLLSAIREVLESDPDVADLNFLPQQFSSLIVNPIKGVVETGVKIYEIIVIDAIDECSSSWMVETLIKAILDGVADIPLKFFISSRPENWIKRAFHRVARPSLLQEFSLHSVAKSDVQYDIEMYLRSALSDIAEAYSFSSHNPPWPPKQEFKALLIRSDGLFIYAATAIRYIGARGVNSQRRLTEIVLPGSTAAIQGSTIDSLYLMIIEQAFDKLGDSECILRQEVLTSVVLFQTPLSITGMASLLDVPNGQIRADLSPFHSVIHVPSGSGEHISIFHASFREFIVDPVRCGNGHHVDACKGHEILTVRCLQLLNRSLRRNICDLREDMIGALAHNIPDLSVIPEALRYSCLYWAVHLADSFSHPLADVSPALGPLRRFADEHLLHWFECLSAIGELETGLKSLAKANETLSIYANAHADCKEIALVFEDARRCLQMGFDVIKHHCLNTYHPVLMWLPKTSLIREKYRRTLSSGPQVVAGLTESWGPMEHIMHHLESILCTALSNDRTRVVSGSWDNTIRIWNATTGEMERILEGHSESVCSVAFSSDGKHIVSGSSDQSVLIWNANTAEIEHVLKAHDRAVRSVAISYDGTRVVSGSQDDTVRIWNVMTDEVVHVLKGHSGAVTSVALSDDGTRVVSGSEDRTVRIWDGNAGEIERVLRGHSENVWSVAISCDGIHVISGSGDNTVRIWDVVTGQVAHTLKGHSEWVMSVAFSRDGTRVVSGSTDKSIRVWNAATGKIGRVMKGHAGGVTSVAFSPDGTRVASGSNDRTVRIWNAATLMLNHVPEGHSSNVISVAFSHDGTHVVSGSFDNLVKIWNASTGDMKLVFKRHSGPVLSVAFSRDATRVVSGSVDSSVRVWNAVRGTMECVLKGHDSNVHSVAFSDDGTHVVSGSDDTTVRIWKVASGKKKWVLHGHSSTVLSVAFSRDGTLIVSASYDETIRIWNAMTGEMERVFEGNPRWVQSVAFSPDGIHVVLGSRWVFGSRDVGSRNESVLIRDAITGKSTSLPYSESFEFPDKSKVTHVFPGKFQLFAPEQDVVSLSLDRKWILNNRSNEACWIPPEFRDFTVYAIYGSKVCLRCESGRVAIVDLTPLPIISRKPCIRWRSTWRTVIHLTRPFIPLAAVSL